MRITLVSSYWPTAPDSYRGQSAIRIFECLSKVAEITALVPLPGYPTVLRPSINHEYQAGYKPSGIETVYYRYPAVPVLSRPLNGWTCLRATLPLAQKTAPDIIMNYWLYPDGWAAVRAGRVLGVPVIAGSIGSDLRLIADPVTRHFVRQTLREAKAVSTVSEELRGRAIGLGAPPEKVTTIVNGCDTAIFRPGDRDAARREIGVDPNLKLVVYAGSFLAAKGLGELIEAFQGVTTAMPDLRLALIGEGPFRSELQRLAAAAGVDQRVMLPGRLSSSALASWMRAADVFTLPSYSEGCPNVIVEALACGCPIVATNVGGIPELCNETSAILLPPRDAAALEGALLAALSRPWDRARIAAASQRNWQDAADDTLALCRKVLGR